MTGLMGESMDEYLGAFSGEDYEACGGEEKREDDALSSWSSAWDAEPEGCSVWCTSHETNDWDTTQREGNAVVLAQQQAEPPHTPASHANVTDADGHPIKTREVVNELSNPSIAPNLSIPAPSPLSFPASPTRRGPDPPDALTDGRRRPSTSTNGSSKAKATDVELRDRLRCLLLLRVPYLVSVGEG